MNLTMLIDKMSILHEKLMEILCSFDDLCRRNNLRYYLIYGALLGYMRNGDLIPWDDDIDIAMPRKDYEELLKLSENDIPSGYKLVKPTENDSFFDFVPRYTCPEYECVRKDIVNLNGSEITEKIGIDVFVIDRSPDGMKHKMLTARMKYVYLQATKFRDCRTDDGMIKKIVKKIVHLTVGRRKLDRLIEKYDRLSKSCKDDTGKIYISNTIPPCLNEIFDADAFGEPSVISVRGHELLAPCDIDRTLRVSYNDYMVPPPEGKRDNDHYVVEMDEHHPE